MTVPELYIASEKVIPIYAPKHYNKDGQKVKPKNNVSNNSLCRTDFELINVKTNETMLLVEVKQVFKDNKLIDIMNQENNKYLRQHMEQLRSYCIHNKKLFMIGVITNFKDWYFTKYNMIEEAKS